MSAQSIRLNTTASNLANAGSISGSESKAYRPRHPVFEAKLLDASSDMSSAGMGVRVTGIVEDLAPLIPEYSPNHPSANKEGYVFRSPVNTVQEMADMIESSRSYQINVEVLETAKTLIEKTLSLGQ